MALKRGSGDTGTPRKQKPPTISIRGLQGFLDGFLDDLARAVGHGRFDAVAGGQVVRQTAQRLEYQMSRGGFAQADLTRSSRQLFGWFLYFSTQDRFESYVDAVERALSAWATLPKKHARWRHPILPHFRPTSVLYRWKVMEAGTRITLDTSMIVLDGTDLLRLGRRMCGQNREAKEIHDLFESESYRRIARELEAAAGEINDGQGEVHDLNASFDRVNREYFGGHLSKPKLSWTRALTHTTFGHYSFAGDHVHVSRSLDHPDVPPFVVDSVMHHELLHKKLGCEWKNGKQHVHTAAFRRQEHTFRQYEEAERFLNRFSGRLKRRRG